MTFRSIIALVASTATVVASSSQCMRGSPPSAFSNDTLGCTPGFQTCSINGNTVCCPVATTCCTSAGDQPFCCQNVNQQCVSAGGCCDNINTCNAGGGTATTCCQASLQQCCTIPNVVAQCCTKAYEACTPNGCCPNECTVAPGTCCGGDRSRCISHNPLGPGGCCPDDYTICNYASGSLCCQYGCDPFGPFCNTSPQPPTTSSP